MDIPQAIFDKYAKIKEICTEHPINVPVKVVADYYGINVETMRNIIMSGGCPYAQFIATNQASGRKYFLLDTFTFFQYATQGMFWKAIERKL